MQQDERHPAPTNTTATATAMSPRRSSRRETGLGMAPMVVRARIRRRRRPPRDHGGLWLKKIQSCYWSISGGLRAAQPLLERLGDARADVYLVGGAVRDLMLGDRAA